MRLFPGACVYPVDPSMRLFRGRLAPSMRLSRDLVGLALSRSGLTSMRLFRGRLTRACVYSGVGWLKHASIPGSVGPSMRLFRSRLTRACVYFGVGRLKHAGIGRLEHASIPEPVDPAACVYSGVGPGRKHASIPGSVGLSMRLSRSRLTRACVYFAGPSMRLSRRPEHASSRSRCPSIPGSVSGQACVYPGIGRPEPSIPEPVDPSMRLFQGRPAQPCVYSGIGASPSMRLFQSR